MKCEVCGTTRAIYHLESRQNHQLVQQMLCLTCAREMQRNLLADGLEFLLTDLPTDADGYNSHTKTKVCAHCQTTATELVQTGKPGCPDCYLIFADEIKEILIKQQGSTQHLGKLPERPLD